MTVSSVQSDVSSLQSDVSSLQGTADTIESGLVSLEEKVFDILEILHRLLLTPPGKRPGYMDSGERCSDNQCRLPSELGDYYLQI